MKLKNFIRALQMAFAALACIACVREAGTEGKNERISLGFSYNTQCNINTKSILTEPGIEYKLSSVLVAAYFSESGKLDKSFVCGGSSSEKLSLLKDTRYDLYFLANMENLSSIQIPEDEKDMKSLQYRIPSYASVNAIGIPACARLESRSFSSDTELPVDLVRLLCKVNVHISHKGITGKNQNDSKLFKNVKLYIRNANGLLSPFADGGSIATSSSDLMAASDYDPDMAGSSTDFVFYVPENVQGQLLPHNLDPKKKSADELLSAGEDPNLATYVEFTGMLMSSGGGIGGSLLYRMYLGKDNVSDFSLERNKVYNLGLDLVTDDLLNPYWKVNHGEDWSDSRVLRLLDSSGAVLSDGSRIAVRPGHSAVVKLFMNTNGGSVNMFRNAVKSGYMTDEGDDPPIRLNWSSNVISADQSSLSLPSRLESEGISVSMNSTAGTVTFSVRDENSLIMEKEYEIEFFLSPGRSYHTCRVRLAVLPECRLDVSSARLLVAQKLKLNVLNALGTYSASIKSGASYVDIDSRDKSVIYGKSPGNVVLQFKSSRPVDDPDLTVNLQVVNTKIFTIADEHEMLLYLDGVSRDVGYLIKDYESGEAKDKSIFDPQNMEKYIPATVYHEPRGDFNPDEFLDYNPYTMELTVKKNRGTKSILDYGDENGLVDRIYTTYLNLPTIVMKVYVRSPFWQYARPLGTFELKSPLDNSSCFEHSGNIDMIAAAEAVEFVFSGKMKPEVELREKNYDYISSKYRISFPAGEQIKYLADDAGEQKLTAIVTNAVSGEELRHDFPVVIKGYFGIGLVLEPAGPDIRDAKVRLCWKDCWRDAVRKGGGPLSRINSIGDINDCFDMYVSGLKEGAEHTVKELWPKEESAMYEDMTVQDLVDFMSSHSVRLMENESMIYRVSDGYALKDNRNVIIEKNENYDGCCRWIGCFVQDADGGRWVDCVQ